MQEHKHIAEHIGCMGPSLSGTAMQKINLTLTWAMKEPRVITLRRKKGAVVEGMHTSANGTRTKGTLRSMWVKQFRNASSS